MDDYNKACERPTQGQVDIMVHMGIMDALIGITHRLNERGQGSAAAAIMDALADNVITPLEAKDGS